MVWREDIANTCTLEIDSEGEASNAIPPVAIVRDDTHPNQDRADVACETCLLCSC